MRKKRIPGKIYSLTAVISHIHSLTKKIFKFVVINVRDVGSILSSLKGRQNECQGQRMSNNNITRHINSPFLAPLDVLCAEASFRTPKSPGREADGMMSLCGL